MAEIILGSVVESITGHLLSLVSDEIGLARGVRLELENLRGTESVIGGVLCEAEKRQVETEDLKEWLKRLRDVAYDADDLLEDFSAEALHNGRGMGGCKRIANKPGRLLGRRPHGTPAPALQHAIPANSNTPSLCPVSSRLQGRLSSILRPRLTAPANRGDRSSTTTTGSGHDPPPIPEPQMVDLNTTGDDP